MRVSFLLNLKTYVLSVLDITWNGPSYGFCNGPYTLSTRTNTWDVVLRLLNKNIFLFPWCNPSRSCLTMFADSKVFFLASAQNSEGKRIVSPYISFAEDTCKSSRYDTLMPRRTVGSVSLQRSSTRHLIAAFNWRWKRNTMPFAAGWYAVVLIFRVLIISFTQRKSCDSNSLPRSVLTRTGVPNQATQLQRMFSRLSRLRCSPLLSPGCVSRYTFMLLFKE